MQETPIFTKHEERTQATFTALMMALSYPGEEEPLPSNDMVAIGETLLDLETTFYSSDREFAKLLAKTTAREVSAEQADYLFFPTVSEADLELIKSAKVGTMLYPDRSATLILGCNFGDGMELSLTGPGIKTVQALHIENLPETFFTIRDIAIEYPLGWDVFFVDGSAVVGLPRTTTVEIIANAKEEVH